MASTDSPRRIQAAPNNRLIELLTSLSSNALTHLRSWSPQLVPVFICLIALPVLLLFSFVAGWIVWSSVPHGWTIPVYLQFGDGTIPYGDVGISSLSTSQPYEVTLQLTVPAIEANYALGNFMASLRVSTNANATIVDIRKPVLVMPPASSFLRLSRAPRLLKLTVPFATSLITGASSVRAHIELGRRDGWKTLGNGEGRELSVYDAALLGAVRPRGLRRIVAAFPITLATTAAITFFTVATIILAGCLLPSIVRGKADTMVKEEEKDDLSPVEGPSTVTRMQRRSSRIKEESDEELSPHVQSSPESDVRRRRRRISREEND